jgi:WD40 repeat protein
MKLKAALLLPALLLVASSAYSEPQAPVSAPTSTMTKAQPVAQAKAQVNYEKAKTLRGYAGDVLSITFSPDGKFMAAGTSEKAIVVWDASNWQIVSTMNENDGDVSALAFSQDGKLLASGHDDKVYLWDTATWKKKTKIKASKRVNALAFNLDNSLLAIARDENESLLWDVKKDKQFQKLKGHSRDVKGIAFSPDGKQVATASNDKTVMLWDAASGAKIKALSGHTNDVGVVAYSGDGKYLLSGSNDNSVSIWDAKTGTFIDAFTGHSNGICTLSFLPNSHIANSGDCILLTGPFGIRIKSDSNSCKLIFWDVETAKQISTLESDCGLSSSAFSPDGKYFVAGYTQGDRFIAIFERK